MSDTEKKESSKMQNQDSFSQSFEKNNTLEHSGISSFNESQDFQLVDPGDEGLLDKSQQKMEENESQEASSSVLAENVKGEFNVPDTTMINKNVEMDKQEDTQKIEPVKGSKEEETSNDGNVSDDKEKHSDEEEEIIQCTPPDVHTPSKMQVPSSLGTNNLKRKAEFFDEPPKKLLRTLSKMDELVPEKKVVEEEFDDSTQEFPKNCTNVIIAETQDIAEGAKVEETVTDEKHSKSQMKDYGIDKNENFNDTVKLDEGVASKEFSEPISDTTKVTESDDNSSLTKDKDSTLFSKLVTPEKVNSDLNNANTDSAKTKDLKTCVKDCKTVQNDESEDKENGVKLSSEQTSTEAEETAIPKETANESHSNVNVCKSRMSIEVIYDQPTAHETKSKSRKELVEIDEDGEKIVLDSSQEDSDLKPGDKNVLDNSKSETVYKSCYDSKSSSEFSYKSLESTKESSLESARSSSKLVNGSSDSKKCDTDSTISLQSDIFSDIPVGLDKADNLSTSVHNLNKQVKSVSVSKDSDHADLLSVSDNEPDVYIVDDKNKSNSIRSSSMTKAVQVEKEIGMYVRMKCLLHVDEGTKEFISKEITGVQCETVTEPTLTRQKNNDTSASLADISGNDNKDVSPGSVNSNPQLYQLNPSRLSFASTISSLSSASSAASLAAKLAIRDSTHFSLPRAPAKHAKKQAQESHLSNDKQVIDEAYEHLSKEWQNSHLLTTTILNFANTELSGIDTCNVSNERIDVQLQKIRSSTPEVPHVVVQISTPKSSKKGKAIKRPRSKNAKSDSQSNGFKVSSKAVPSTEGTNTPSKKKNKADGNDSTTTVASAKLGLQAMAVDELIGKTVFAKWSDNNYYPGVVIDKIKMKYKVNFYDGKSKVLIEDFVIPIPNVLNEGLSVYATTTNDDYGSCGIIVDTQTVNNEVYYTVETDEGDKLHVQVKDLFLSSDQAQVLKEEFNSDNPSTPKHLSHVSLDNMVDGKRRSKRIATPSLLTPKAKLLQTPNKNAAEPSVSGESSTTKKEKKVSSESDGIYSDSNVSIKEETSLMGVQPEIIGTPFEQIAKGPQSRIKSKSRSKKKAEDEETIMTLGPIPKPDSNLFKGMSFILTCASLETIDRYQIENKDYGSDPGTENEEEWEKKPFVRDRLETQIVAGGGKVYNDFNEIPKNEYKNTKLITNVPNTTAKSLLCLSVGIPAYNHNWIIRCCQKEKIVNPAEDELPAGWSLEKQSYIEIFQRSTNKPLTELIVIIPVVEPEKQFRTFWSKVCENAGGLVAFLKKDVYLNFVGGAIVLTNIKCPSWAMDFANQNDIPMLSTTWIVQCLIEGKCCEYDSHPRYKYNYIQN